MSSALEKCELHALCESCRAIFEQPRETQEPDGSKVPSYLFGMYKLHESVEDLEESIRNRCHFCTMAGEVLFAPRLGRYYSQETRQWTDYEKMGPLWLPENSEKERREREARRAAMKEAVWVLIRRNPWEEGQERIDITCGTRGETGVDNANYLKSFPEHDGFSRELEWRSLYFCWNQSMFERNALQKSDTEKNMVHDAHSYMNTSSHAHMQLAQYWLDECLAKHPSCAKSGNDALPSRLIYIEDGTSTHVHLHETDKARSKGSYKYCALSHCWGGADDILLLKKDNFAEYSESIPVASLAKNFQDAIRITASLGMHYIWIDSLCIIQDSGDDWAKESAMMGSIYQNATCTIASSAAINSHKGCFVERDPLEQSPCKISGLSNNMLFVTPVEYPALPGLSTVKQSKLQSRAWVFQEAILSSRTLYFAEDGIYWSCKQGVASERDADGWGSPPGGSRDTPPKSIFGSSVQIADWEVHSTWSLDVNTQRLLKLCASAKWQGTKSLDDFSFCWRDIVRDYSEREMTKAEDKLVALSAVAQRIQRASGFTYVAGLWQESFIVDLLWIAESPQMPAQQPVYRGPSWSWAASYGLIRWEYWAGHMSSRQEILVQLQAFNVSTHELDVSKTGRVYDAKCRLRGVLKSVSDFQWDPKDVDKFPDSQKWVRILQDGESIGSLTPDSTELPDIRSLFLIPLLCETTDWGRRGTSQEIFGLGVKLCAQGKYFERVGRFNSICPLPVGGYDDISATTFFEGCSEQDIELV